VTPVDFHPLADAEALKVRRYYARKGRAGAAVQFLVALDDAEARISANPSAWSPDTYGTRSCRLKKFPYRLIYVEEPNRVLVVALAHDHRRPGYWHRRLTP
jgi:plasmid stabilization system protein ParE